MPRDKLPADLARDRLHLVHSLHSGPEQDHAHVWCSGRGATLVDENGQPIKAIAGTGTEHLSTLKEAHLRELADVTGLGYVRLRASADLASALRDPALSRRAAVPWDLRIVPLCLALALLCAAYLPRFGVRRRLTSATGLPALPGETGTSFTPGNG